MEQESFYKKFTVKQFLKEVRTMSDADFKKMKLETFDCITEETVRIICIERRDYDKNEFNIIIDTNESY